MGENKNTHIQYEKVINQCRKLFIQKTKDYGSAWRILRSSSITDLLYAKANRIRSIQEKGKQKVKDSIELEFISLINYAIIAIIQNHLPAYPVYPLELKLDIIINFYNEKIIEIIDLLDCKNHDYDEAWRNMKISSMVDLILMKLIRIKKIEDNKGQTLISEGIKSGYQDIVNYAVFCLILMEKKLN